MLGRIEQRHADVALDTLLGKPGVAGKVLADAARIAAGFARQHMGAGRAGEIIREVRQPAAVAVDRRARNRAGAYRTEFADHGEIHGQRAGEILDQRAKELRSGGGGKPLRDVPEAVFGAVGATVVAAVVAAVVASGLPRRRSALRRFRCRSTLGHEIVSRRAGWASSIVVATGRKGWNGSCNWIAAKPHDGPPSVPRGARRR